MITLDKTHFEEAPPSFILPNFVKELMKDHIRAFRLYEDTRKLRIEAEDEAKRLQRAKLNFEDWQIEVDKQKSLELRYHSLVDYLRLELQNIMVSFGNTLFKNDIEDDINAESLLRRWGKE